MSEGNWESIKCTLNAWTSPDVTEAWRIFAEHHAKKVQIYGCAKTKPPSGVVSSQRRENVPNPHVGEGAVQWQVIYLTMAITKNTLSVN